MFSNDKRPCGAVFLSSTLAFLSETEGIARYPVTRDRSGLNARRVPTRVGRDMPALLRARLSLCNSRRLTEPKRLELGDTPASVVTSSAIRRARQQLVCGHPTALISAYRRHQKTLLNIVSKAPAVAEIDTKKEGRSPLFLRSLRLPAAYAVVISGTCRSSLHGMHGHARRTA